MIRVLSSGISTTIQDLGRFGFRKYGVPVAGSMDQTSAIQANLILGNEANSAVIEMLVKGPRLLFEDDCWICISGAPINALRNQEHVAMNLPVLIKAGQELNLGIITAGRYTYLALKGGVQSEEVMQSLSQSRGVTFVNYILKGSVIKYLPTNALVEFPLFIPREIDLSNQAITVFKGPEFDDLSIQIQEKLLSDSFRVSNDSNRMGYRLESTNTFSATEIITSPVQPGTVQMTPSGQLIVLMRDAQTTGGYARVLQLTSIAIHQLAQKRVGETIIFEVVS